MLHYREFGQGPAVLLLHGFPLDHTIWEQQMGHLSDRYRVIAPDLPGLGRTPPLSGTQPTIAGMAREVLSLMDHLGVKKAAVAGHSMGGYIALVLQKLASDRVSGLAFICSQAGADTPEAREARFATARKVHQEGPAVVAGAMGPKLFAPGFPTDSPVYRSVDRIMRRSGEAGVTAALYAMADREDHRQRLGGIGVPTLVLAGEQDLLLPPERADFMARAIPGAALVRVPGAGHMPMLEQPAAVNGALAAWLGRIA